MDVLWDSAEEWQTGREVADQLPDRAYTTVLTILDRLRRKGLVVRSADDRTNRFSASASRETYMAELMVEALDTSGDRDAVLVRFAEVVSAQEAAVLRQALERLPSKPGGGSA